MVRRVLLVGASTAERAALADGLPDGLEMTLIGDPRKALAMLGHTDVDVIVVALGPPGSGGPALCHRLIQVSDGTSVVGVLPEAEIITVRAAIRAGVRGLLVADSVPDELARIMSKVVTGEQAFGHQVMRRAARFIPNGEQNGHRSLNLEQFETFELLARGLTERQIADELVIPPETVSDRLRRSCQDLGASELTEAVGIWRSERN